MPSVEHGDGQQVQHSEEDTDGGGVLKECGDGHLQDGTLDAADVHDHRFDKQEKPAQQQIRCWACRSDQDFAPPLIAEVSGVDRCRFAPAEPDERDQDLS